MVLVTDGGRLPSPRRLVVALWLALAAAFVVVLVTDHERTSMVWRGDYPAFYSAGALLLEGRSAELFSFDAQRQVQQAAWPAFGEHFYMYAYPPVVALLFVPTAMLGPLVGKGVATFFFVLCAVLGALLLRWLVNPAVSLGSWCTRLLFFVPFGVSVIGVQNTSLSLLLLLLVWCGVRYRRAEMVGLAAAAVLFKPQYGLVLLPIVALAGWRAVGAWGVGATGFYLGSFWAYGGEWLGDWLRVAHQFAINNETINNHQFTSLPAVLAYLGLGSPLDSHLTLGVSAVGVLLFGIPLLRLWLRWAGGDRESGERLIVTLPLWILLTSPQATFYDLGLALPALWQRGDRISIAICYGGAFLAFALRDLTAFPLPFLVAMLLWWRAGGWRGVA